MNNVEQITDILLIVLAVLIFVIMILAIVYLLMRAKNNKVERERKERRDLNEEVENLNSKDKKYKEYTKDSVFNFMDFEKIEDSMIIQKKGKFLMVIECQGVNYDLMSEMEKVAVEQGFLRFLNTLRHPVQLYIQTRTVNLEKSIIKYKDKLKTIEDRYRRKEFEYEQKQEDDSYTRQDLQRAYYEIVKEKNLYEYTKDIIEDIEKTSLNRNVLNKKYYIIVPQYQSEMEVGDFSKDEIQNMAFSELYTKCKSIIRTLYSCQVTGKILDSEGLVDLLYVAYNRDESDIFGAEKAYKAGFGDLYSTSQDIYEKKIQVLNSEIERRAIDLANEKIEQVVSEKEEQANELEENLEDLIRQVAENVIDDNRDYLGDDIADEAINIIQEDKGGNENEKKQTKRGRRKTTTI